MRRISPRVFTQSCFFQALVLEGRGLRGTGISIADDSHVQFEFNPAHSRSAGSGRSNSDRSTNSDTDSYGSIGSLYESCQDSTSTDSYGSTSSGDVHMDSGNSNQNVVAGSDETLTTEVLHRAISEGDTQAVERKVLDWTSSV